MNKMHRISFIALAVMFLCPIVGLCDGSRLVAGDIILLVVDGEKDSSRNYQIDTNGYVDLSMVGLVKIAGYDTTRAAADITKALDKVLINPHVSVSYVERAKMQVSVVGQVKNAGLVDIGYGDTVLHALTKADYDNTADLSHVNVRRGDQIIDLDLTKYLTAKDLTMNIPLQSGDTVVVPLQEGFGSVMVIGQVDKVGTVPLSRDMTFREVIGLVGGITVEADSEIITIKREGLATPITVDYTHAMDGDPSADIALKNGDTIYVPQIETSFFTVMGGVGRPGQFPLKGKLTLSEAVGMAGGPVPHQGDMRKVNVVRSPAPGSKDPATVMVDLTKVISKGENDPLVMRGDVIWVAQHKQKLSPWNILQSILPFGWLFRR